MGRFGPSCRGAVPGLVVALIVLVGLAAPRPAAAGPPRAGDWIGSVQGRGESATRFLAAEVSWNGDFSFHLRRDGSVHGFATVAFDPSWDTNGLDALIDYVRGIESAGLEITFPLLGPLAAAQVNALVGIRITFAELMPVREGPITGSYAGGRLHIRWAGRPTTAFPFRVSLQTLAKDKVILRRTLPVGSPWRGDARTIGPSQLAARARGDKRDDGVRRRFGAYWSAHRVG